MVVHTCNSSYVGGRDRKDCGSRLEEAKKKNLSETLSQKHKLGVMVHAHNYSYAGKGRRIVDRGSPGRKSETLSKRKLKQKRAGGVAQVVEQGPGFKLQYH
jgi:hypothetical protein